MHLVNPLHRFLPIHDLPLPSSLPTRTLLLLMPKLGSLNPHPHGAITQPRLNLIHQAQSERHRVHLEEDDECFSTESPVLAGVHLDFGFAFIAPFDHLAFAEPFRELVGLSVLR